MKREATRDTSRRRPRQWEHDAIRLMIGLCRETGCRVHIVHLSSADAVPMIVQARGEGLPLFVETCPHYLFFAAEEIPDGDPRFKCAPPIRERENRERLWEALRCGAIDTIGTDHSPAPHSLKHLDSGDLDRAWGGIASLQVSLPAVWTEASRRGFSIASVAEWMATPAGRAAGLCGLEGRDRRRAAMPTWSSSIPRRPSPCKQPLCTTGIVSRRMKGAGSPGESRRPICEGLRYFSPGDS